MIASRATAAPSDDSTLQPSPRPSMAPPSTTPPTVDTIISGILEDEIDTPPDKPPPYADLSRSDCRWVSSCWNQNCQWKYLCGPVKTTLASKNQHQEVVVANKVTTSIVEEEIETPQDDPPPPPLGWESKQNDGEACEWVKSIMNGKKELEWMCGKLVKLTEAPTAAPGGDASSSSKAAVVENGDAAAIGTTTTAVVKENNQESSIPTSNANNKIAPVAMVSGVLVVVFLLAAVVSYKIWKRTSSRRARRTSTTDLWGGVNLAAGESDVDGYEHDDFDKCTSPNCIICQHRVSIPMASTDEPGLVGTFNKGYWPFPSISPMSSPVTSPAKSKRPSSQGSPFKWGAIDL